MKVEEVQLHLVGPAGASIKIIERIHGDEPVEPYFVGQIGPDGKLTVNVPRMYCVALCDGCDALILSLREGAAEQSFTLAKRKLAT